MKRKSEHQYQQNEQLLIASNNWGGWGRGMVFNTFQQYFSYIVAIIYWWRKADYPEKTTDLPQVADKLYHITLYWVYLTRAGFKSLNIEKTATYVNGNSDPCLGQAQKFGGLNL